jgi:7-cyano-7-deazaguanine synthase
MPHADVPYQHRPAVILLSGGLDSSTVLAIAQSQGFDCHCLSFRYGQRHTFELEAAKRIAASANVADHRFADIDLRLFGGSALTDASIAVPKDRPPEDLSQGVPVTYVPARNTIFLSFALAFAETIGAFDLFIGVNALDYSGYPDCRPEYIAAFEQLAKLATRAGVEADAAHRFKVHTPLIALSKAQIIRTGMELGVDYALTHTCYDPDATGRSCGHCDACLLRLRGFAEAGWPDPAVYAG